MIKKPESGFYVGLFKMLADETRLRILCLLRENELSVGELQKILKVGQSTISSQLGVLREQKIASTRKEGQRVYYKLSPELWDGESQKIILDAVHRVVETSWAQEDQAKLNQILKDRSKSSKLFFDSFPEANTPSPGQTWESFGQASLFLWPHRNVLDMGCGSGHLSFMLYLAGKDVIGVDNSEERIKSALQRLNEAEKDPQFKEAGTGSLKFIQADMEETGLPDASMDLVVISHALHHVAKPLDVLRESHRLLRPGGHLFLLDLVSHHQDWIREKFGDFWLGFSHQDLNLWLRQCGFTPGRIADLEQAHAYPEIRTLVLYAQKETT